MADVATTPPTEDIELEPVSERQHAPEKDDDGALGNTHHGRADDQTSGFKPRLNSKRARRWSPTTMVDLVAMRMNQRMGR